jgi:hypothetical protein
VTERERNPKPKKYVDPDNGKTREFLPVLERERELPCG